MTKSEIVNVLAVFIGWRLVLGLVAVLAPMVLAYQPTFPYADSLLAPSGLPQALYSWANFDGVHYITIVEKGYEGTALIQAFFPVFPLVVSVVNSITNQPIVAGLLVSNIAAAVFYCLWFALVKQMWGTREAWLSLGIFLLFPTSFFLGGFYSESLFLCFVAGSFLAAYKRKWWLAGLLAALASGTRVVGVLLVPVLWVFLVEEAVPDAQKLSVKAWQKAIMLTWKKQKVALAWVALGLAGIASYMIYLQKFFNDALYFFHVQAEFGGFRQETIVFYPQVLWRSLKIVLTFRPFNLQYLTFFQEFVVGLFGLVAILLSFRKVRWSICLFSLGVFLVPTLTGTFSSVPRYILASLSVFIWLALVLRSRPWVLAVYLVCSTLLLLVNTILFIQGYWVA